MIKLKHIKLKMKKTENLLFIFSIILLFNQQIISTSSNDSLSSSSSSSSKDSSRDVTCKFSGDGIKHIKPRCSRDSSCDSSLDSSYDNSHDRACDGSFESRWNQASPLRNNSPIRTQLYYRSVGDNIARQLVGWQWELYRPDCENYGTMYVAYEYQRTFKSEPLIRPIFGANVLQFQGSMVTDRRPDALIADNFGLSRTCDAAVIFCPKIENHIFDIGFYAGLNSWVDGLFLLVHAPVVHTRWDLGLRCNSRKLGSSCRSQEFSQCYVSSAEVTRGTDTKGEGDNLYPAYSAATIEQALSGSFLFGDMQTPWRADRFPLCRRSKTALANIDFNVGYNWFLTDCYHFGGFIRAVAPTGNRVSTKYLFSPQAGNNHHWELGGGLTAHSVLFTSENANLSIWFEGWVTHMFSDKQRRTFDLENGAFSRYLLLKEYQSNGTSFMYSGNLVSGTNFTTQEVDVKINVKGDAAVKLAYRWRGWGFDLGYEVYGNQGESIERICNGNKEKCRNGNVKYGIKGTETVCCTNYPIIEGKLEEENTIKFVAPNGTEISSISSVDGKPVTDVKAPNNCEQITKVQTNLVRNNTNQPSANMFTPILGTNRVVPPISDTACNVCLSPGGTSVTQPTSLDDLTAKNGYIVSNTGYPQFLGQENIDFRSAEAPSVLSHKIFVHFNYMWLDDCGWNPHVGLGFEVEFDGKYYHRNQKRDGRNSFDRIGFNQWGIWIKGGVSF
jgi:hypothetical protein